MSVKKVVHCKVEPFDVYIGRPSKWGNPFPLKSEVSRRNVLEHYRIWILGRPDLLQSLYELDGKILGCWCAPRLCHGDVLAELVDVLYQGELNVGESLQDIPMQVQDVTESPSPPDPWTHCEEPMYMFETA